MKKIPILPNIVTAFGLTCGLFAIFKINMIAVGEVDYPALMVITGFLALAAFADLLDGAVARALKAQSDFGGLFDSLADAISFGVAPALIVLKSLSITPKTELSFLITTAALVYVLCGVLRLVRFNLLNTEAKENAELYIAHKKNFTGLPIPAAAAAAISLNLFLVSEQFRDKTRAIVLFIGLILLGYFMISRLKFPSLKSLRVRVSSFRIVFLIVIFAVIVFYGLLNFFPWAFLLITWAYVIIAWILSLIRVIAGRKSKTLEDFEPEPDDDLDEEA